MEEIKAVKGVNDILPQESSLWQKVEQTARDVFAKYGYKEIRTPIFEATGLFQRGIGTHTDIVQKEMYSFEDQKGRNISLRPEGTASVVRAYLEHGLHSKGALQKLYYLGPMFRYEKPQAGRSRQFHQIGIEAIGSASAVIDAETIILLKNLFLEFGIDDITIKLNSSGCSCCREEYQKNLKHSLKNKIQDMCHDCQTRYEKNIMRVLDCKHEKCQTQLQELPDIRDAICDDCSTHFDEVLGYLDKFGVKYIIEPRLVRGLDYYNRTVFEVTSKHLGSQDAVAAGGRYDYLIKSMGGPETPAIGFALGMERLVSILIKKGIEESKRQGIYFAPLGQNALEKVFSIAEDLRAKGLSVQFGYDIKSLKAQMRYADKQNFKYLIIVGDEEVKAGVVQVKDLDTGEIETSKLNGLYGA